VGEDGPRDDDEATDRRFAFSNDAWSMEPDVFLPIPAPMFAHS